MTRGGQGTGRWLVALSVGVPLVVAAIVVTVVFAGTDMWGRSPLHQAVDSYLDTVGGEGAAPMRGPESGCPQVEQDPAVALRGFSTPVFEHEIVSSTASGDSASVNVDLKPKTGGPIAVVLDLRRTGDRWEVCSAATGRLVIDADPF
ncbi:hypothetical protein [Streptomyces sp. NPDC048606]|uniref:hypothetical protein n=1 Tax=Streptomyces sp. NPDC048606 TaxID=3154726 RepID=UPI00341807D9